MQLISCSLLLVLLAAQQTPGLVTQAAAPAEESATKQPGNQQASGGKSPQLLYMKKLREDLKNTRQIPATGDKKIEGSLLATSIEAENVMGPGQCLDYNIL